MGLSVARNGAGLGMELRCDGGCLVPVSATFVGDDLNASISAAQRLGWKLWVTVPTGDHVGHLGPCCSGKVPQ
jgi:hypothetical protein